MTTHFKFQQCFRLNSTTINTVTCLHSVKKGGRVGLNSEHFVNMYGMMLCFTIWFKACPEMVTHFLLPHSPFLTLTDEICFSPTRWSDVLTGVTAGCLDIAIHRRCIRSDFFLISVERTGANTDSNADPPIFIYSSFLSSI